MTQFNERAFAARFSDMGDEAERVFEEVWSKNWVRTGFNRPPCSMRKWSLRKRYTPDYSDSDGWIEVQGFGRDRVLKIKDHKAAALSLHMEDDSVRLFIWDTTTQRWAVSDWRVVSDLLTTPYIRGDFHEGNPFSGLHADQLDTIVEWNDRQTNGASP